MPERLQKRLLWGSNTAPLTFVAPGQLLLYVGLSDNKSLDSTLRSMVPALQKHILAFDIRREPAHDILGGQLYDQLCTHAWKGELQGAGGGPNCRTWSILRWFPKPGAPVPVRQKREPECWGLPMLQPHEELDTDNDSLLLLRLMLLAHIIQLKFKGPGLPWCFLEIRRTPTCAQRVQMRADAPLFGRRKQCDAGARALVLPPSTLINASWDSAWPNPLFLLQTSHYAIGLE